ncbi:UV radiation resistance-associated gene protein-like [Lucilia sericata]|uniref:UV radiation resistance-associated gene protein-like n=1 Tax=Lucilia sericata TaxID=13632 RepID=UPI0018A82C23|nr:UV radiation resistance-associated gene protein-like [Lucilia sericata]
MNIRPRCREWLPLSTQQLRLRNLQAIQGVNIEIKTTTKANSSNASTQTLLYYTLHDHPENEPFYQSEKVALRKHLHVKWAEIQCPEILKSNANCVCIKIWACIKKTDYVDNIKNDEEPLESRPEQQQQQAEEEKTTLLRTKKIKEPMSALTREFVKFQKLPRPSDALLFSWAIYFSGLIPLSQNTEVKCCENSLIFQMNDEYFASPELFNTECLRQQLALNYERYSASVPKCSIPTPDEFTINSPQVSRSSSPVAVDWQKDLLRMSKTRYVQLNCVRSEVRTSYDLMKLLRLQQLQRQRLQTQRESVEMTADIKRLSLRCITKEQLLRKPRTTSINSSSSSSASTASQYHSMGRTLSLLLAEQQHIDPHQLLRAQQLQLQVESLKSKQRLLLSAQETFSKRITQLRQQLNAATTSRQQLQTWLTARRRKLHEDKLELENSLVQQLERRHRRRSVTQHVERVMSSLCLELRDIYPIARNRFGLYTICGVPFPTMDGYVSDSLNAQSVHISENITPMALSASLGYVAHLVEMISVVLNRPLRNPIIHEGSRTRIMDVIKDIPSYTSREFPLYSRSSIPTKPVKYAVNLLNQNISQLCFDICGIRCDMRATIDNLLNIFATFVQIEQNKREIHSRTRTLAAKRLTIAEINNSNEVDGSHRLQHLNNHNYQEQNDNLLSHQITSNNGEQDYSLSKSHSSVDMNHMMPPTTLMHHHHHHNVPVFSLTADKLLHASRISSQPIDIQDRSSVLITNQQRNCRSVGSYTDSEEEVCHSTPIQCFSNSDSNLTSLQSGVGHHHHHIMQMKTLLRPVVRYNYIINQRTITHGQNSQTGGEQQQKPIPSSSVLKRTPKDESSKWKLKMYGWQIHSYGGVEELQFTDKLKMPQLKQANECLVRVTTTTVNPIDVAMLNGYGATVLNTMRCQGNSIEFPLTLGREFCGILVQKGMNVDIPLGQRVWGVVPVQNTNGAHAEYVAVTNQCLSLAPKNLSDEEAASVLYAGLTAWSGLYVTANIGGICGALTADGGGGQKRILVLGGSGSVGSLAIQMLKAQGTQVVATCSENAKELVKSLGSDVVIDYNNPEEMSNLRSFALYDVVLDCSGQGPQGAESLNFNYKQYVTFSSPLLKNIDNSGLGLGLLKNVGSILETNFKSVTKQNGLIKWGFFSPAPQGIEFLKKLAEREKISPLIDSSFEFEQLPAAFDKVSQGHLRGKVVVNID